MASSDTHSSTNVGLVIGGMLGAWYGLKHFGNDGIALVVPGAFLGTLAESLMFSGKKGQAPLLITLVPIAVFIGFAWLLWQLFIHNW